MPAAASFFEHQHLARRNSRVMLLLFLLAVLGVVAAVDLVLAGVWLWTVPDFSGASAPNARAPGLAAWFRAVPAQLYLWGAIATAGLIFAVSLVNAARLGGGGAAVAEMIGARRVPSDTRDALERRLLNVVEEMAIASGVRVPAVYVMDEERGINAFAAGWDVSNSVVAVTRGTLETLTRDELQGVIGHEFSHILNGDMRLNIRMIGILAGIVFISSIGSFLLRSVRGSRNGKGVGGIVAVGVALFVVGYVGMFFARLIKAAVSRQREFLADASSVQFTRNPDGIAGALDQIRVSASGALIANRYAEEMSHMFFGQGIRVWLGGLFDTHPPLDERIRRVNPNFAASAYRNRRAAAAPAPGAAVETEVGGIAAFAGAGARGVPPIGRRGTDFGTEWGRSAGDSMKLVGAAGGAKVDYAARLLASLPVPLREALRDGEGARGAMLALLLARQDDVMQQQLAALDAAGFGALGARAKELAPLARSLGPAFHLPVVDLALPALKAATDPMKQDLVRALEALIAADRRQSLHRFVVLALVRDQLAPKARSSAMGTRRIADLASEALTLLSLVAHAGVRSDATGERQEDLQRALRAGAAQLGLGDGASAPGEVALDQAARALDSLKSLDPLQKAILVKGLFAAVTADGTIRLAEAELMRLVGAVLDCPLPPLLEALDPATLAA